MQVNIDKMIKMTSGDNSGVSTTEINSEGNDVLPVFFATGEVLEDMINGINVGDGCVQFALEITDGYYTLIFKADEHIRTLTLIQRGEVCSYDEFGEYVVGKVEADKVTGGVEYYDPFGNGQDFFNAYFAACEGVSKYIVEHDVQNMFRSLDDKSGILLSYCGDKIAATIVSGKERPDLLCTDLFDNDIVCRPYIDEKTEDDLAKFNGEDEPSFDEIIKKAEAGDAQAQADYAIYVFSMGMQDNFKKAFSMVKKSAKQDNVQGICTLAQLYHAGIGCKQNIHKAAKWYLKGAELDDAHCQYNCFCMVMNDEIHEDKKKAVKWLERAAEQGHVPSQMGLARLYEEGSIYSRDINKAIEWGEKAAVQENPEAQFQLAKLYLYDAEDLDIQYEFEDLYMDDKHCNSIDEKSAISWLKQAADNGHDEACYILDSLEKYL